MSRSRHFPCGSRCRTSGEQVFKNLEAVDTPDEKTAIFRFSQPTPVQLIRNALPVVTAVVPKHVFDGTDIEKNPANEKLIGTGPFKLAEHKPGEYYLLKRNEGYWGEPLPYLDEIVFQVLPDRAAAANALEAEQIQLAAFSAVPLADLDRISKCRASRSIPTATRRSPISSSWRSTILARS